MFFVEALLLAFALCVDSFTVSAACAFRSKMSIRRGLLMAVVFALFQGSFPFLGALFGMAFHSFIESIDHWVAFALLLFVGGKMIIDAFRSDSDNRSLDVTGIGVMCLLGVATSIDAFAVGISLGLDNSILKVGLISVIITVVTFVVSLLGVALGRRRVPVPERVTTVIAGLVLIGIGVFTLVEHLSE